MTSTARHGQLRFPRLARQISRSASVQMPARSLTSARRIVAFVFMVFGMFMAILDIQIVSASLSEIQAGLSASADEITWVQTSYLIAEVIMIPLSGFLSRVLSTRYIFAISAGGFTLMSFMCATPRSIERDDRLAGAAGLHRRRHDPDRVRLGVHDLPAREAADRRAGHRSRRDARADDRADGRRLSHRLFSWHWLFLVNIVPGIIVTRRDLVSRSTSTSPTVRCSTISIGGPSADGASFSAPSNMCSKRGRRRIGSRGLDPSTARLPRPPVRRRLLLARVHRQAADRRPHRLQRPQFLDRLPVRPSCSASASMA